MSKIVHLGNAEFVDTDPVDPPEGAEAPPDGARIYPYAEFRSLEHVSFGLKLTAGGPRDEEIDSIEVGQYGMEPLNPYWDYSDALPEIRSGKYSFEEVPYVELTSMEQYAEAIFEFSGGAEEATDEDLDGWEGPGLYDFRDSPPTFAGTVEENELEEMERAADEAFDFMFQGEEWEDAYRELAESEDE